MKTFTRCCRGFVSLAFAFFCWTAQAQDSLSGATQTAQQLRQHAQFPVFRLLAHSALLPTMVSESDSIEFFPQCYPEFRGGAAQLQDFLQKELRYPEALLSQALSGVVKLSLIVDKEGKLSKIYLTRSEGKLMDDEALRVAYQLHNWLPATQAGRPVRSVVNLQLTFSPK
jgi:periplasmic protein TonB